MLNSVDIVIEKHYHHIPVKCLVFHVDIKFLNENMNSLKYKEKKKFYSLIKICQTEIIFHMCRCIQNL